jgi:hypothetical protein
VLQDLLPECLAFVHADLHAAIDWARRTEFLDKELQAVARRAATGRRHVDLLVKLWLRDGREQWVLLHIEVQGQGQDDFAERMYLYHTLLYLQHRRPIVSLAILVDARADWRPDRYAYDHWGCAVVFRYPTVKILGTVTLGQPVRPGAPRTARRHRQSPTGRIAGRDTPRNLATTAARGVRSGAQRGRDDVPDLGPGPVG